MSESTVYRPNPDTYGTAPMQFFESDGGSPPAGAKATPRPASRPRQLPPADTHSAELQLFECEGASAAPEATDAAHSPGQAGSDD
jgi:hypothetical protein